MDAKIAASGKFLLPQNMRQSFPRALADLRSPCCVCKEEKSKRDECMLFSKSADPAADCRSLVDQYKSCMIGYGFKV
ncbi:unnamed protein product [Clonostachys solani]|uniref:Cytochrome c oxidase assembly protein subunit 17 n=1 Tax=Clonostachys solani TaxID=160281 RepID=A0A9N9Z598_9HYPO|nr:unnamed protein product [Clonostachys solani]